VDAACPPPVEETPPFARSIVTVSGTRGARLEAGLSLLCFLGGWDPSNGGSHQWR
jgi:hypothetical protein